MRLLILAYVVVMSLVFAVTVAHAEVAIYAKHQIGDENTYETEYGYAGDWHIACTTQLRGSAEGRRWCSLEPMASKPIGNKAHYAIANGGVRVKVWRDYSEDLPAGFDDAITSIDFVPARALSPQSDYAVACGDYAVRGIVSSNGGGVYAYSGPQAVALLSAMTEADACTVNYVAEDSEPNDEFLSVAGLEALLAYAASFTDVALGR